MILCSITKAIVSLVVFLSVFIDSKLIRTFVGTCVLYSVGAWVYLQLGHGAEIVSCSWLGCLQAFVKPENLSIPLLARFKTRAEENIFISIQ